MIQAKKLSGKEAVTENNKYKNPEENGLVYSRNGRRNVLLELSEQGRTENNLSQEK